MNKNSIQGFFAGLLAAAALLALSGGALAAATNRQLNAAFNDIKIYVDGAPITAVNAAGQPVEPFIVDGTTYLPLRAVAQALGQPVEWDEASQSVYIGERPGNAQTVQDGYKLAFITNTLNQSEEEYCAAEEVARKYGADKVLHFIWPENFLAEQDKMLDIAVKIAADSSIKALIINQAAPGTAAVLEKLRETRDDIFIVCCAPQENPADMAALANLLLQQDDLAMGPAMVEQAAKMGAKTFVHCSFPRHLSQPLPISQHKLMEEKCAELGLQFVNFTILDPASGVGVSGMRQYILDEVPKLAAKYGQDTAFFSTICASQPALIQAVMDSGAIYPQSCCPSPYHGFPWALGILDIEEFEISRAGAALLSAEISRIMVEKELSGRFAAWPVPISMLAANAAADYAFQWMAGEVSREGIDLQVLQECLDTYAGVGVYAVPFEYNGYYKFSDDGDDATYDNWLLLREDYITY